MTSHLTGWVRRALRPTAARPITTRPRGVRLSVTQFEDRLVPVAGPIGVPAVVTIARVSDAAEGGAAGLFRLTRTGDPAGALAAAVSYAGTATRGADYPPLSGTVTFAAGSPTADLAVPATADGVPEPTETVTVALASLPNYTVGTPASATLTIIDNDPAPRPAVSVARVADGAEGGASGLFRFTRTGSTSAALTATYSVLTVGPNYATPGSDYQSLSGAVTFAAGAATADVPVVVTNDATPEPAEDVGVAVTAAAGYVVGSPGSASLLIADNDTSAGRIAGVVWGDTDGDGIRETGEAVRAGVPVSLLDANGSPLFDAVTDAAGGYSFAGLAAGGYAVDFDPSPTEKLSPRDATTDDKDSDADPASGQAPVTLTTSAMTSLLVGAGFTLIPAPPTPTGTKVVFTTSKGSEPTADDPLKVAKWQEAFEDNGSVLQIKGPINGLDFIDRDDDRFNVRVYDRVEWNRGTATVDVTLATANVAGYEAYNDPATTLRLVRMTTGWDGWYFSDSQMLVSNAVDDSYSDRNVGVDEAAPLAPPNVNTKVGYNFPVSDRTHRVALGGTVEVKYGALPTVQATVPISKIVNLHPIILSDEGGNPIVGEAFLDSNNNGVWNPGELFTDIDGDRNYTARLSVAGAKSRVQRDIKVANESYAQVGIQFRANIEFKPIPAALPIADGKIDVKTQAVSKLDGLSASAKSLLSDQDFNTIDRNDVEIYYVTRVYAIDVSRYAGGAAASSDIYRNMPIADDINDSIMVSNMGAYYTLSHELTHLLSQNANHALNLDNLQHLTTGILDEPGARVTDTKRLALIQQSAFLSSKYVKIPNSP